MTKILFSEEAGEMFRFLEERSVHSKKDRMIFNAIQKKLQIISENIDYGDAIPKYLIPSYYKNKYFIKNLYRLELPCFWRMLYSASNEGIEIIAFVIDIVDHDKYDRKFGYRKR